MIQTTSFSPRRFDAPRPPLPVFFVLAMLLIVSRRPDVLFHATLWAEDGWRWYPDAYDHGWRCIVQPWTGYLQTFSRLIALISVALPLRWVPTVFAAAAILVQAGTATFMLSDRLSGVCSSWLVRAAFALLYVLLPNSFEVFANLTNAQWHLAILAFLVCIGRPPTARAGYGFDAVILLLSGLSGPCCVFVLPVLAWRAFARRSRADMVRLAILLACVLLQLWCLLGHGGGRSAPPLGAGPRRMAMIVSMQVILPLLLGRHTTPNYIALPSWQDGLIPSLVFCMAAAFAVRTLIVGPSVVRLACVFGGGIMLAALLRPAMGSDEPAWYAMSKPDVGDRYYVIPMLAWAVILFAAAIDRNRLVRWSARGLLALMAVMLPGDWGLPSNFTFGERTDFVSLAERFDAAPSGTEMRFPVNPLGVRPMVLRKH